MELYARVRRAVVVDKMSEREAARQFGLARETVRKMLRYSVPPGYRRQEAALRPKLDAYDEPLLNTLSASELAFLRIFWSSLVKPGMFSMMRS